MRDDAPSAVIVVPTLCADRAAKTAALAQMTAGMECAAIIICDYKRRGDIKPANPALEAALALGAPYIVFLSDDVAVKQEHWLVRMIEVLEADPSFGIAAPSGNCRGGPQMRGRPGDPRGHQVVSQPLAWFLAVIKREVFEQVGLFDENLIHYAGDTDLSRRAHKAGWKSVWVKDVYVEHDLGQPIEEWWQHDVGYCGRKHG